jgi:hypothetical protein
LILRGDKDVENRSWRTHHRGRLAIHASITIDLKECRKRKLDPATLPTGVALGTVEAYDRVEDCKSKWAERGHYHWLLRKPKVLPKPKRARGNPTMFWVSL